MPTLCSDTNKLIPTYLDGELAETELLAFEHHVAECADCEREVADERDFLDTVRSSLAAGPAPDTLRARLGRELDREEAELTRSERRARRAWILPGAASLAAAAALLVFVLDLAQPVTNDNHSPDEPLTATAADRPNPIAVSTTSRDTIDQSAREFLRIPVRAPRFADTDASLEGWKPMRKRGHLSALFVYQVNTGAGSFRLEVQTLDARNLDLRSAERRVVNGTEVWVTQTPGVSAVTYRDANGVAYIFTSHMDTEDLVTLVVRSDLVEQLNRRLERR
jgi:hypothetical protein